MSIYQYSLSSIGWSFFFLSTLRCTAHCLNPWQGWNERSEIMPSAVSTIPFQRYCGRQVTNEGGSRGNMGMAQNYEISASKRVTWFEFNAVKCILIYYYVTTILYRL